MPVVAIVGEKRSTWRRANLYAEASGQTRSPRTDGPRHAPSSRRAPRPHRAARPHPRRGGGPQPTETATPSPARSRSATRPQTPDASTAPVQRRHFGVDGRCPWPPFSRLLLLARGSGWVDADASCVAQPWRWSPHCGVRVVMLPEPHGEPPCSSGACPSRGPYPRCERSLPTASWFAITSPRYLGCCRDLRTRLLIVAG